MLCRWPTYIKDNYATLYADFTSISLTIEKANPQHVG